jgi:hypothetical protein
MNEPIELINVIGKFNFEEHAREELLNNISAASFSFLINIISVGLIFSSVKKAVDFKYEIKSEKFFLYMASQFVPMIFY